MGTSVEDSQKTAIFSKCGLFRYRLTRGDLSDPLVFIMLNPSTADANDDDRTVESCLRFVEANNKTGLIIYNLYSMRSRDPGALWESDDPVGVDNDLHLIEAAQNHKSIVCAWGVNARADRVKEVTGILLDKGVDLLCIGKTKSGSPQHPLFKKAKKLVEPWSLGF